MIINVVFRSIMIIICSIIIGINRGKKNEFAGLNTHLFVGIGSGLSLMIPLIFYLPLSKQHY